jgi:hypothetical protein
MAAGVISSRLAASAIEPVSTVNKKASRKFVFMEDSKTIFLL